MPQAGQQIREKENIYVILYLDLEHLLILPALGNIAQYDSFGQAIGCWRTRFPFSLITKSFSAHLEDQD